MSIKSLWEYIINLEHLVDVIGVLLAWFALIVPIRQYLGQKRIEEKDKRFTTYHKLIKELVQGDSEGTFVQRQAAVVFELRNYPEYYEVTKRLLHDLDEQWATSKSPLGSLLKEMSLTLAFIERHEAANRPWDFTDFFRIRFVERK